MESLYSQSFGLFQQPSPGSLPKHDHACVGVGVGGVGELQGLESHLEQRPYTLCASCLTDVASPLFSLKQQGNSAIWCGCVCRGE